jgi:acyl dehydratase
MTVEELAAAPRLGALYRAAALGTLRRRPAEPRQPDAELVLRDIAVDLDHLAAYNRVCGFRLSDTVPATYPHVLGFPLALALMTRPDFPLPLLGIVHLANRTTIRGPLRLGDGLTVRVRPEGLRPHDRGRQIDLVTEAYTDGVCVWQEHATYLSRDRRKAPERAPDNAPDKTAGRTVDDPAPAPTAKWRLPGDSGARYARVSGDRNPIHTSRVVARLAGFPRRIAHGMWLAARCLAALEGRLPDAYTAEFRFRRPVPLPSKIGFTAAAEQGGWRLSVDSPGGRHVSGQVKRA